MRVSHADPQQQRVHDPADMREQYRGAGLSETDLATTPFAQFTRWFEEAVTSGLHEPNAMVVSTVDAAGSPHSRTVLLKGYDERGFVFFTNYRSRKGRELAANPAISLLFPWHSLARQVIITGVAERTGRDETAAYFRTRPHGSQLGTWASRQSEVIGSRAELDRMYAELADRYPPDEQVPVPTEWGGFRVIPHTVEFWQGRANRLHDRLCYLRDAAQPFTAPGESVATPAEPADAVARANSWRTERLCP
ncbi:pyridoxamine 5'-phosphate oxidase [Streptomyces zagrosensis]|uniref:Pyridoxine/pyridoxamine 5'-phosphate oxidase n=1 Tax=Streptomyces zagrosensis TaxID=1042984 RepID=A0A7W9Q6T7_9ACTN|nr:pyridoxamine 5'-phosphate oxidase [Streptomyces zagrosensis]MBB5934670.1 pyridoxamine 5'-phosphate oxidase [Streptomyces zagrosensis]